MHDPDATKDELDDDPNYYSILNICKDASDEEIKSAYRRMCVMYHPDKHRDPKNKEAAEAVFSKVFKAYEVLSVPQTRMIYDIYGQKGLDAGWDVVERRRTPEEIRQEYDRLQREAEERRIEQRTNPKGTVTLNVDASDMFRKDDGDPYYYDEYRSSWLPEIQIRGMSFTQSIEAPLTTKNTAILSGSLEHTNGDGHGGVNCSLRRVFSHKGWGEMEFSTGNGGSLVFKAFRNLDKKRFGTIQFNSSLKQFPLIPQGFQAMIATQLSKNTMGYWSWMLGRPSSMSTILIKDTDTFKFMMHLQLGIPNSSGVVEYTHKFGKTTKVKTLVKYSTLGFNFEYGCEHKLTSLSRAEARMCFGYAGVTLNLRFHRHTQKFEFPILLSDVISPSAIFYGTLFPVVAYFAIKALVITPMLRQQKERDLEESREKHAQIIAEKKREAESAVQLMLTTYEQMVETEQGKHGLVILEAWYGKFISKQRKTEKSTPYVINVTIPIQCLVKDSKLLLGDTGKSQIPGIYDPCIGEEKLLKITYEFRGSVHEAIFKDEEPVRMPKQSHVISTKIT